MWCDLRVQASDSLAEFRVAAEAYIGAVESTARVRREEPRKESLTDLAAALSALYNRALFLPEVWDDAWAFPGETDMFTDEESERRSPMYRQLEEALEGMDFYWTVVAFGNDALEEHGHLLSDDLADIYWDLQEGFDLLQAGGSEGEASWTWRFSFWSHWGAHSVDALRVIHARLAPDTTSFGSED